MSGSPRRRVLLLTPQLPYPPDQGTSLRNFHIVQGLAQALDVHLLSFVDAGRRAELGGEPLASLCRVVVTVQAPSRTAAQRLWRLLSDRRPDMAHRLQSPAFQAALRDILSRQRFDVVQIEGIEMASHISTIRQHGRHSRIVFDDHNAEAELQRRMFATDLRSPDRWLAAAYSMLQWRRLRRFERWACLAADGVSVVSDADRAHLRALAPGIEPLVVPNCIDVESYEGLRRMDADAKPFDMLFIGKMDYRPNVDAVLWFGDEIWPLIREHKPDATWAVVGKEPHPRLQRLAQQPGVTVTGAVPEIKSYLSGACVYVMPFRIGSGTRLKLIEALASGIATVSTHVGAEGYPLVDGRHLLLADDPADFARAVLALLDQAPKRLQLQAAGREFARRYDWRRVIPRFFDLYDQLLAA